MMINKNLKLAFGGAVLVLAASILCSGPAAAGEKSEKAKDSEDPYAEYVWPPAPNQPRIRLEAIISERLDVEAAKGSKLKRFLAGTAPKDPYDQLQKPMYAAFDPEGRILVSDWGRQAIYRFDIEGRRMDVFGVASSTRLQRPMGLTVAAEGTIYVADIDLKIVVAFDPEGTVIATYGGDGELMNPVDVALSHDESSLIVADSKAHQLVVFGRDNRIMIDTIGTKGSEALEFAFPSAVTAGPDGNLFVVDQLNTRVQLLDPEGEYLDEFGSLGKEMGNFVRPKDVAVDEVGFIYVVDHAFNNFQIFDTDFTLLTFVGTGGRGPGQFQGASGIAVQGNRIAVVDQLNSRVQVFRFIASKTGD